MGFIKKKQTKMRYHKYNTLEEVESAINQINQYCGIPASEDSITQTYANYYEFEDYYLILSDDVTTYVLGEENIWETEDE